MFRIGEFSRLTQVSVRMLRHYDEVGLLRPAQIDEATGYRLYSVQQIPAVQKIVLLRNVGFGIAEIAAALADWDRQSITQRLMNKAREIEEAVHHPVAAKDDPQLPLRGSPVGRVVRLRQQRKG